MALELGYTVLIQGGEQPWSWPTRDAGAAIGAVSHNGDFRITPFVGARYVRVRFEVDAGAGGRDEGEGDWLTIYGGLHAELNLRLGDRIPWLQLVRLEADMGAGPALGGDGGLVWHARAGMTVMPTPNVGVTFGYRLLEIDAGGRRPRLHRRAPGPVHRRLRFAFRFCLMAQNHVRARPFALCRNPEPSDRT